MRGIQRMVEEEAPRILLLSSPDNPTGQLVRDDVFVELLDIAGRAGCFVVVDFAYRTQCFVDPVPLHFSASPAEHPHLIRLHSNSKWCRGLGRRLGWIEAAPEVVEAVEVVQQSTALCPDSVHQYALASYLETAVPDGSLASYLAEANARYRAAARATVEAVDRHLGLRCLEPEGGLYTVVDVGRDGDEFVGEVLSRTGVIFVPGSGFGESLRHAVRVSYGPLVADLGRIAEGFRRVGETLGG